MEPSEYGVHANHCCEQHGCKYGARDCPVVAKIIAQEYPCEQCNEASSIEGYTEAELYVLVKRYKFIEEHASYIEIEFDGMRGKVYLDRPGMFESRIDQSMNSFLNPEED